MTRPYGTALNPWQLLDEMRDRLDRGLTGYAGHENATAAGIPADVLEENDHILVKVNLPGADANSVNLSLENNTLTLTARLEDEKTDGQRYLYR